MITILLSLALSAASAPAAPSNPAPPAQPTQQTAKSAKPTKPKKVCEKIQMSGSNVPKRVCRTVDPAPVEAAVREPDMDKPATASTN